MILEALNWRWPTTGVVWDQSGRLWFGTFEICRTTCSAFLIFLWYTCGCLCEDLCICIDTVLNQEACSHVTYNYRTRMSAKKLLINDTYGSWHQGGSRFCILFKHRMIRPVLMQSLHMFDAIPQRFQWISARIGELWRRSREMNPVILDSDGLGLNSLTDFCWNRDP